MRASLVLLMMMVVPTAIAAVEVEPPTPIAAPTRTVDGYDWESRSSHSLHFLLPADESTHHILLRYEESMKVDIELTNVAPTVLLSIGNATVPTWQWDWANARGKVVFWQLPPVAGTWAVRDPIGTIVTTISFHIETPLVLSWASPHNPNPPPPPPPDGGSGSPTDPQPPPIPPPQSSIGYVVEQAAYSFDERVRVSTSVCRRHSVTVDSFASGGAAVSAKVGGTYTESGTVCESIVSEGIPVVSRQQWSFKKTYFADGSYRIDPTGRGLSGSTTTEDVFWYPGQGTSSRLVNVPWSRTVSEEYAGGVSYSSGVSVFGIGLGVHFYSAGGTASTVTISVTPDSTQVKEYWYQFINGNQESTGIVGVAWGPDPWRTGLP